MSNSFVERLTTLKDKKNYLEFDRTVKLIKADYELYFDFLEKIIEIIEEVFYSYKSEDYKVHNRLKEDYEVIFSDDIQFFFCKYVEWIGEENLLKSKQGLQLFMSVAGIFSLSYKIEEYTKMMQKIVDSDTIVDFESKKYALSCLLAPDCWMYLTKEEWERYIHINDTQPYGQELNETIRNFAQFYERDER